MRDEGQGSGVKERSKESGNKGREVRKGGGEEG